MAKSYIGDGVYVEAERGMLKLTTENGLSTTNTVYLEPEVWEALKLYARRVGSPFEESDHPADDVDPNEGHYDDKGRPL